eukprot:454969-Hanusia_phi.AAC.3
MQSRGESGSMRTLPLVSSASPSPCTRMQRPLRFFPELDSAPFPDPSKFPEVQEGLHVMRSLGEQLLEEMQTDVFLCKGHTEAAEGLQDPGGGKWTYTKVNTTGGMRGRGRGKGGEGEVMMMRLWWEEGQEGRPPADCCLQASLMRTFLQ